jgi:hypothetical protein
MTTRELDGFLQNLDATNLERAAVPLSNDPSKLDADIDEAKLNKIEYYWRVPDGAYGNSS